MKKQSAPKYNTGKPKDLRLIKVDKTAIDFYRKDRSLAKKIREIKRSGKVLTHKDILYIIINEVVMASYGGNFKEVERFTSLMEKRFPESFTDDLRAVVYFQTGYAKHYVFGMYEPAHRDYCEAAKLDTLDPTYAAFRDNIKMTMEQKGK